MLPITSSSELTTEIGTAVCLAFGKCGNYGIYSYLIKSVGHVDKWPFGTSLQGAFVEQAGGDEREAGTSTGKIVLVSKGY